tara:strand:+ start:462 stop:947 length:486 start_codon:yes stop_codon:yes gene_type:complete
MSTLKVDTIQGKTTASKVIMPAGHVLQIQRSSVNQTSHESFSSSSFTASSLSVDLTPKASGNKVLVQCHIGMGAHRTSGETNTALYIDGSNVSSSNSGSSYYWAGYWTSSDYNFHGGTGYYEYTTVDTNSHNFRLYVKATNNSFDFHRSGSFVMICTEIQS